MLPNLKFSYYNFYIPHKERDIYIIYNSFANAMVQVDWEKGVRLSRLNSMEIHHLDIETIELLKSNRMIIHVEADEFKLMGEYAADKRKQNKEDDILFLLFSPTNTCNMSCPYCYQGDKSAKNLDSKYLSPENIEAVKEFVHRTITNPHATPIKSVNVEWFGGEPLLQKGIIRDLSKYILNLVDEHKLGFFGHIITNGYLLDDKTWELFEECRITDVQVTIDGNEEMHNKMRSLVSGKGSYATILENVARMPKGKFNLTIRINGDREVFDHLPTLFDDFEKYGLWPQRQGEIGFHWAPKFFNFLGFNQEKNIYFTSYDYQKSREDFALLRLDKYNKWAERNDKKKRNLKIAYPESSKIYCNTVESPNSFSLDSSGYIHKCYNTVNNKAMRIQHISEFTVHDEKFEHYTKLDKTAYPECKTCKVLPICDETCNMRMVDNAENKICTAWKFFMNERMISIYEQQFADEVGNHVSAEQAMLTDAAAVQA
jgi:uncharacterized protein